jgi:hypothetical protein
MMNRNEAKPDESDKTLATIRNKVESIKKTGFGEVRILIRNGAVYRILTTEDEAVDKG